MDARSRLNDINHFIEKKLKSIQALFRTSQAKSLGEDDFPVLEYQKHQKASQLFYYCLIVAYGHLAMKASLDQVDPDAGTLPEKYQPYDVTATRELCELQRLMAGKNNKDSISQVQEDDKSKAGLTKKLFRQFKEELGGCEKNGLSALFSDHLQTINLGLIKMAFVFLGQNKQGIDMRAFFRRMLILVMAIDFVFKMQHETRERVFNKLKYLAGKDFSEVKFLQQIFGDDEVGAQGFKITTEHPFSTSNLVEKLKEMIDLAVGEDAAFENLFLEFKEKCKNYGIAHPTHLKRTPQEETVDRISKKLSDKLKPLKVRYLGDKDLGVNGEFDGIDAMVDAVLDDKQPLPQDGRLAGYVDYLRRLNKPAPTLDQQINSVLDELDDTTSTDRSPLLSENRNRSNSSQTPAPTPALSRKRSQSHLGQSVATQQTQPVSQAIAIPSARVAGGEPHHEFTVRRSETVPFRRPNPVFFQSKQPKPSILKHILIGAGIGFSIAVAVALCVGLAFAFAPSAPAALAGVFLGVTKLLATTAIGTWSTVAVVLASPPIVGFAIGLGVWRRKCEAMFAAITAPVTKAFGSTRAFFEREGGFHSELVRRPPPSVKMSASEKFRREREADADPKLPTVVGNHSTLYPPAVSPTPGASESASETPSFKPE